MAFLESGCALIVGCVSPDGEPHASRAWGADVLDAHAQRVRLLLDGGDDVWTRYLVAGCRIAVTACNVPTLHSIQLKGRVERVEEATPGDVARSERFIDQFFTDVGEADLTPRALLDRMIPARYVACEIAIEDAFDQTPGPVAGAPLSPDEP